MDAATAAKAQQASSGEDTAAKAKAAGLENTAKLSKAGCKMSQGCNQTDNNDGTYTLSGKTKAGIEWSKTFVDPTGSAHKVGAPDANYVAKVKAQLGHNLNGDHFTLTALPAQNSLGQQRAPVNGIQIVYPSGS